MVSEIDKKNGVQSNQRETEEREREQERESKRERERERETEQERERERESFKKVSNFSHCGEYLVWATWALVLLNHCHAVSLWL